MELKTVWSNLAKVGMRKVKLVEEGGKTLASLLVRPNPLKAKLCDQGDCQVCLFSGAKGRCGLRSSCYVNTCLACKTQGKSFKYWDETSDSVYERSKSHMYGTKRG